MFYKDSKQKSGYSCVCKQCKEQYKQEYRAKLKCRNNISIPKRKECNLCGKSKSSKEFNIDMSSISGLTSICSGCSVESSLKYYYKNTEKCKENNRLWHRNNLVKSASRKRNWKKKNPDAYKKIKNKYTRKRRAIGVNLAEDFSAHDDTLIRQAFNNICFNCGSPDDLCIDHHKPLSKGFALSLDNAALLCRSCNSSKGNKMPEEFYSKDKLESLKRIYEDKL